jgi:hypothetical protein
VCARRACRRCFRSYGRVVRAARTRAAERLVRHDHLPEVFRGRGVFLVQVRVVLTALGEERALDFLGPGAASHSQHRVVVGRGRRRGACGGAQVSHRRLQRPGARPGASAEGSAEAGGGEPPHGRRRRASSTPAWKRKQRRRDPRARDGGLGTQGGGGRGDSCSEESAHRACGRAGCRHVRTAGVVADFSKLPLPLGHYGSSALTTVALTFAHGFLSAY